MTEVECPQLVFRNGKRLDEPVRLGLLFLESDYSYRSYDSVPVPTDATLRESDLRIANHIGARMSAAEIGALMERRSAIETALRRIGPEVSLGDPDSQIPWDALHDLYSAAEGVRGIGLAKLTKALHKKRPRLIPMLDSVVAGYLRSVDSIPSGGGVATATALTRGYKRDLDANREALECVRRKLEARGYVLTLCRILDLYTWAYAGNITPAWSTASATDDALGLARDLGIAPDPDGMTDALLKAAIRELGYVGAHDEIGRWLAQAATPKATGSDP